MAIVNKTVIVPNTKISEDNIINWTTKGTRRVDLVMGIDYGDDIDKAKQIMADVVAKDDRVLKSPAPQLWWNWQTAASISLCAPGPMPVTIGMFILP